MDIKACLLRRIVFLEHFDLTHQHLLSGLNVEGILLSDLIFALNNVIVQDLVS